MKYPQSRRRAENRAKAVRLAKAEWDAQKDAEITTKEAEERNKSCLESITTQCHENQGVVYTPLAGNQTFKIDGAVLASLKEI